MEAQLIEKGILAQALSTIGPMEINVAVAGDDDTGDGSGGSPYATVERAFADLPPRIKHECKILIDGGDYTSGWPQSINNEISDDGSLALVGVGVPVVESGLWTVTGVADIGTAGQQITIAAGGLGADDALCGQTIMIATGGFPDQAHQVVGNTDTTIDIILVTNKMVNADTLNLVVPAVKIALGGGDVLYNACGIPGTMLTGSRLVLHNIWFDLSASAGLVDLFQLRGLQGRHGITVDFARFELPAAAYGGLTIADCSVNGAGAPYADSYILDGSTGITNLGGANRAGFSATGAGARDAYGGMVNTYGRTELSDGAIKGVVALRSGEVRILRMGLGGAAPISDSPMVFLAKVLAVGVAGEIGFDFNFCQVAFSDVHIIKASHAIRLTRHTMARLVDVTCDPTTVTGSGCVVGSLCQVQQDSALPNLLGASVGGDKAYTFAVDAGGVKSDTWHAGNYGHATDTKGANITRED